MIMPILWHKLKKRWVLVVTKRKVSGGKRRDTGRKCLDTFLSLKQTCLKLHINFITFLKDRVCEQNEIPRLAEIIRGRSSKSQKTTEAT